MAKRKTTALDRAVLRFIEHGKRSTFEKIYHAILPTVEYLAKKYAYLFPGMSPEDLIQEAYIHLSTKVIPVYDAKRASFKTLVTISVRNKFRQLLSKIRANEDQPTGLPLMTFTEYEFASGLKALEFQDQKNFIDEILVADFLRLFKERMSADHWEIYWQLYKDPALKFKDLAKDHGLSVASLYRKSRAIYSFLKMLIEKERDDD